MDTQKSGKIDLRSGFNRLSIPVSIGVYDEEREKKQPILVTISMGYSAQRVHLLDSDDRLGQAFDYAQAADLVKKLCSSAHFQLIEHLALKILAVIRANFPDSCTVKILVEKPEAVPDSGGSFCELVSEP